MSTSIASILELQWVVSTRMFYQGVCMHAFAQCVDVPKLSLAVAEGPWLEPIYTSLPALCWVHVQMHAPEWLLHARYAVDVFHAVHLHQLQTS